MRVARTLDGEDAIWTLPNEILDPQNPLFIPNVSEAVELDDAVRLALRHQNIAALVSLPMRARSLRGAPLGWSVITFALPHEITPETEQFLTTLNDNTAVALDNRYLFESTEAALQETAALYGATTNLSRARSAEDIGEALHLALETLVPDMYGAYLLNDDGMMELFNINLDGSALDFRALIDRHHLLETDANLFIEDLRQVANPTPFEQDLIALGGDSRGCGGADPVTGASEWRFLHHLPSTAPLRRRRRALSRFGGGQRLGRGQQLSAARTNSGIAGRDQHPLPSQPRAERRLDAGRNPRRDRQSPDQPPDLAGVYRRAFDRELG